MVSLVHVKGCWHQQWCLDVRLKIKPLIKTSEVKDRWFGRRDSRDCAVQKDVGGDALSQGKQPKRCLLQQSKGVAESKGIHTYCMYVYPTLTLHQHHWPIHLIDRSVASSAKGVWHCRHRSVPYTYTHTYTHYWSLKIPPDPHLERGQFDLCPQLGGSWQEGRVGALSLKPIPSMKHCGTYIWGQDRKTPECTVAGVEGDHRGVGL